MFGGGRNVERTEENVARFGRNVERFLGDVVRRRNVV